MYGTPTSSAVPGSLQPAAGQRPAQQQQTYPASQATSTAPHIASNAQQYTLPTRSNTISQMQAGSSHSYSRSSPAGLQEHQKYIPFTGTPASGSSSSQGMDTAAGQLQQRYPQTPQQTFYASQTPTGGASAQSPLVLDQIRPRANSSLNDDSNMFGEIQATNSNYVAPWAAFAFDWCKYPMMNGDSAGKMAIGSYLEDPHNFVCCRCPLTA
jgi:DDB1- and CUL4-associated factor 7